jgi:prevent-host-death family protein
MSIGIRALKARASELVRNIREKRARYIITYRGRPVAVLSPLEQPPTGQRPAEDPQAWDDLRSLGEKISHSWTSERSAAEILAEMRR